MACAENDSNKHGTKGVICWNLSVALWNSLQNADLWRQGISCSSGLQGRTALSNKEVLAEKAKGWGNCSIHHIADIPKKYSKHGFWLGGHMQIPRDGKKKGKMAPWYYSCWHVLNPFPTVGWGTWVFMCNNKDKEGGALLLTDRPTGCSWSQIPQDAKARVWRRKSFIPKESSFQGTKRSWASFFYSATWVFPRECKPKFGV